MYRFAQEQVEKWTAWRCAKGRSCPASVTVGSNLYSYAHFMADEA